MKAKELQELIDFIAKSELDEVKIETDEFKVSVKRNSTEKVVPTVVQASPQVTQTPIVQSTPQPQTSTSPQPKTEDESSSATNYIEVKAPMIGTFYRASNPETPAFVEIGDEIKVGQALCIIEAMKLFNEIESEVSGKVVKVLVDNASPVEYDQPLFLVEPN